MNNVPFLKVSQWDYSVGKRGSYEVIARTIGTAVMRMQGVKLQ